MSSARVHARNLLANWIGHAALCDGRGRGRCGGCPHEDGEARREKSE
ncbi:MAG TPA: hypothetical protein VNA25_05395 [Phycisphaerae bacterium]|nr:hypothetical protein [Phycisphaerae bacterium]